MKKFLKKIDFADMGILFALIILWLFFIVSGKYTTFDSFMPILREASWPGICGIGMTFAIMSKHFDLSVASQVVLCACAMTFLLLSGIPVILVILMILVLGILLGVTNGFLVAKVKIPAFIVTLGMMSIYRALAQIISNGEPNTLPKADFGDLLHIGSGKFLGFPIPFLIMVVLAILATIVLRKTAIGRHITAIGNSEEASEISGISVDKTKIVVFAIVGFFTAIAAILTTAYLSSSNYGNNIGFEFTVISSVVLGGTALAGGKGSIFTTIIAAIFIYSVRTGLQAFGVNTFWQEIIQGIILLFAFSINGIRAAMNAASVKRRARADLALKMKKSQSAAQ